jgi:hypothetical protein
MPTPQLQPEQPQRQQLAIVPRREQPTGAELADPRTASQRSKRKRRDTHQVCRGAAEEIAVQYPRFSPSSEHVANRAGVCRAAVVDFKIAQFEKRIAGLEARIARLERRAA